MTHRECPRDAPPRSIANRLMRPGRLPSDMIADCMTIGGLLETERSPAMSSSQSAGRRAVQGCMSDSFRRGLRAGVPFSIVGFLLSMSFGVLAIQTGFTPLQAIVMSAVVHAGAAQFAAAAIVAGGGGVVPGVLRPA